MKGKLKSLIDRLEQTRKGTVLVQLVKFTIVGTANTALTLIVSYALIALFRFVFHTESVWSANLSSAIGYFAGIVNSYYWNKRYVFKNRRETSNKKTFIKVCICYGVTYLVSLAVSNLILFHTGISSSMIPILQVAAVIPISFAANKLWAYKDY